VANLCVCEGMAIPPKTVCILKQVKIFSQKCVSAVFYNLKKFLGVGHSPLSRLTPTFLPRPLFQNSGCATCWRW